MFSTSTTDMQSATIVDRYGTVWSYIEECWAISQAGTVEILTSAIRQALDTISLEDETSLLTHHRPTREEFDDRMRRRELLDNITALIEGYSK